MCRAFISRLLIGCFVSGLPVLTLSCNPEKKPAIKTNPISFTREGELSIYRTSTDSLLIQLEIEIADSDYETQTGLMYREAMDPNQAMFFIFPSEEMHSFYMKNTKIPLDLLFIRGDQKIATIAPDAQPLDESGITSRVPVQYVLEVNAGMVAAWNVKIGDSISFTKDD